MKRLLSAILCLLAALLLGGAAAQLEPTLDGIFFDAGKADAILLTTAHGAVLIDCGEKGFGKEIVSYCTDHGVEKLDCLIVTHFDKDHVGGAARVLRELPVDRVLQSNFPRDSIEYAHYLKALRRAGLEPETIREALYFTLDGVNFTVDPPRLERYADSPSNNASLIVTAECGDRRLLLPGDAETARLTEWLADEPGSFDLVKMPHHGNWDRTLPTLLAETRPAFAVITSSEKEPESAKTLALLQDAGAAVFLTREAPVLLRCEGAELHVWYAGS